MDDVLDEWSTAILKFQIEGAEYYPFPTKKVCSYILFPCFFFSRLFRRHDIAHKIKELNERLDVIALEKARYNFNLIPSHEEPERQKTTSFVDVSEIHGRDDDKETILSELLCESSQEQRGPRIISIVGMGGVGKTTLAQLAYNDDEVKAHFEKRIWVFVSEPFDEIRVTKMIVEVVKGNVVSSLELQVLLQNLHESILGKKFLLVLDGVWTEDYKKWEPLKHSLTNGALGSRILVTTRNQRVAKIMGTAYMHLLGRLPEQKCWLLFSQIAFFGKGREEQEKLDVGRKIAKRCQGPPLAAKTLGSLMRYKETKQEWQNILDSEIWEIEEAEKGIFPPLLLSYYDLSSPMKQCFSFCAIFPKDYKIGVDRLIKLWMAQGYLRTKQSIEMEKIGREYFESLAIRSLFQDFEKDDDGVIIECKMHDIVHDFAQYLSKNECFIVEFDGRKKPRMDSLDKKGRHSTILLAAQDSLAISNHNTKKLHTLLFMPQVTPEIANVLPDLFHSLTYIRALDLSGNSIKELPKEVGKLIHMRYLNLSSNIFVELLETLGDLCNLQTLNLNLCMSLVELPQAMGKLINLRHLEINCNHNLRCLPKGIGRLSSLWTLSEFIVGGDGGCTLGHIGNLNYLQGHLCIRQLGNVAHLSEAMKAELKNKKDLRGLTLHMSTSGRKGMMDDAFEALELHPNLEVLKYGTT